MKMDFKEIGRQCVDWINLVLDNGHWQAVANTVLVILIVAPHILKIHLVSPTIECTIYHLLI
jgi:hypothetical protein